MIRFSFALATIFLVAQGAVAQSPTSPGKAEATAQRVLGGFFADFDAAASAQDIERFFGFFNDSPDLVFAFNGKVIRGFDAVKKMHADSWAQLESVRFKTIPKSVVVLDANRVLVYRSRDVVPQVQRRARDGASLRHHAVAHPPRRKVACGSGARVDSKPVRGCVIGYAMPKVIRADRE